MQANSTGGPEQSKAFDELKTHLANLTKLASPLPGEGLILYVSASHQAVSAALVLERKTSEKKPDGREIATYQ